MMPHSIYLTVGNTEGRMTKKLENAKRDYSFKAQETQAIE